MRKISPLAGPAPAVTTGVPSSNGLERAIRRIIDAGMKWASRIEDHRRRRQGFADLERLSERELRDVGLVRLSDGKGTRFEQLTRWDEDLPPYA